jgi:hypothetical protein
LTRPLFKPSGTLLRPQRRPANRSRETYRRSAVSSCRTAGGSGRLAIPYAPRTRGVPDRSTPGGGVAPPPTPSVTAKLLRRCDATTIQRPRWLIMRRPPSVTARTWSSFTRSASRTNRLPNLSHASARSIRAYGRLRIRCSHLRCRRNWGARDGHVPSRVWRAHEGDRQSRTRCCKQSQRMIREWATLPTPRARGSPPMLVPRRSGEFR